VTKFTDNERKYYVYTLAYPQGFLSEDGTDLSSIVFYVGKGTVYLNDLYTERIDQHEIEARSGFKSKKCDAIREIWKQGLQVQKSKVYETISEADVIQYEKECIKNRYLSVYLTNDKGNIYAREEDRRKSENYWKKIKMKSKEDGHRASSTANIANQSNNRHSYDKEYLTVMEACAVLGVSTFTLNRHVKTGRIKKYRRGLRNVVYKRPEVEKLRDELSEVRDDEDNT
jgi:excisionase family DNA binding protein